MSRPRRTIALDFDGVLHRYNGWNDGNLNGPIDGAKEAVEAFLDVGDEVVVFSTRNPEVIASWLERYDFPSLDVTSTKRPFYVMVDDRAVRFEGRWGADVVKNVQAFEPYWATKR